MRATPWLAALGALALAGCASLTSNTPLFEPADQVGPAPLAEGAWIWLSEDCSERNARRSGRLPARCLPVELARLPDGAWSFLFQDHVPLRTSHEADAGEIPRAYRLIIAPATMRQPTDAYAPLYVAEYAPIDRTDGAREYAIIVPIGPMPARRFHLDTEISCHAIARDGPIEGVEITRSESDGQITACLATSQAGVREAARRAIIESLSSMFDDEESGWLVLVRP